MNDDPSVSIDYPRIERAIREILEAITGSGSRRIGRYACSCGADVRRDFRRAPFGYSELNSRIPRELGNVMK